MGAFGALVVFVIGSLTSSPCARWALASLLVLLISLVLASPSPAFLTVSACMFAVPSLHTLFSLITCVWHTPLAQLSNQFGLAAIFLLELGRSQGPVN